jgi:hypothetical protein
MTGKINFIPYGENSYPQPHDIKDSSMRECVRIINDNAVEDKPSSARGDAEGS